MRLLARWAGVLDDYVAGLAPLVAEYGYPVLFLGALLEHTILLGVLLPGATFVALGGLLAHQGYLRFEYVVLATALGSLLGDHIDYLIGRHLPRGTRLERRYSVYVANAERLLHRWGGLALVGAKFVNATRSVIAVSAGFCRFSYPRFLVFEIVAVLLWASTYTASGYVLGLLLAYWYLGLLVGPVTLLLGWRWRARLRAFLFGKPQPVPAESPAVAE